MTPPSGVSGLGARGGLLAGAAGPAFCGPETSQFFAVDQNVRPVLLSFEVPSLDVPPEDSTVHPDLLRGLGNGEQPSFLHAGKRTETGVICNRLPRLHKDWLWGKITTCVASKEAPMPLTRAEAETYVGKYVVVTWPQTPEQQAWYGCLEGSLEGVIETVDDEYLVTDDGFGVKFTAIKSIEIQD